ncbi:phosphoesterase [Nonlabens dokdonensis]|uniref:Phosphoesterase n=1 Tax=Nonlabens dokdonensis TaxID=328515 RepID=A0A1Z8B979_9FLAO|nr:metallophosphoesterase [Nonlabens dokdonensis]OUS19067.1 phosphoesterase [Nonlabens dokdonensis]
MRLFLFIVFILLLEVYSFQLIRTLSKGHWWKWVYLGISILVVANVFLQFYLYPNRAVVSGARDLSVTLLLSFLAAKSIFILFMLGEDIYRFVEGVVNSLSRKREPDQSFFQGRRDFIAKVGLAVAALPFGAILYGAWRGKYDYQIREYELSFDDLPEAFDGYKITQLSDIHVGSFDDKEEVKYAIDLANKQQSDLILFTGDLVNNVASEMEGWEEIFGSLNAPDGVYSVLGNHDYGDYAQWDSKEAKAANMEQLYKIQEDMGWRLLMDENERITRKSDSISIVGVQNWGGGRFPKYGDLEKASAGLTNEEFKVLLSHDPTHWDLQVKDDEKKYHLTLSGHTHGMQFGIEIPGFIKLSPAWFVYKKWAGIYKEAEQFLNVNRGFGFLGYSGRAGIWPEITVITLRKSPRKLA